MTITVANKQTWKFDNRSTAVYCGRPSPVGNPFIIGRHGSREAVIARYAEWFDRQLGDPDSTAGKMFDLLLGQARLGDVVLLCFCAPRACHCDIIKARLEHALATTCEHEGCTNPGIPCHLADWDGTLGPGPHHHYCHEHIVGEGFCYACGTHALGHESFEFGRYPGLCEACRHEPDITGEGEGEDEGEGEGADDWLDPEIYPDAHLVWEEASADTGGTR